MTANILVVDDLEPNIKLLEAKLINEYYTVFTANSGQKAFQVIKDNKIDLVLLDIMMPNMDGFEVCRRLKSNPETAQIPVVMVTALSDIEDRVKGLEAGADEFLTKPINDIPLFARVKSLTRTKALTDELTIRNQTNQQLGISTIDLKDKFNDRNILVLNDDAVQIKNITKILKYVSDHIKVVTNQQDFENLDINVLNSPDLVILNANLGNYDALRVCVVVKSKDQYKNAALMMVTEDENDPKVIKGMELGVNDYFVYPVDKNELIARIRTQLRRKKYQDDLRNLLKQSVNLAVKDGLTNIFNRRYLDIYIIQMINNANKTKRPLCVLMFDIDYFKKVNDTYGHREGDIILKIFASVLKDSLRISDLVARYGGEEFIALLKDTSLAVAAGIAERIRINVENTKFFITDEKIKITVSSAVTLYKIGEAAEEFLKRVDDGLYRAKNSGRNKVIVI